MTSSASAFVNNLNNLLLGTSKSNAVYKLANEFKAEAMGSYGGHDMAPYFSITFADLERFYASKDVPENVPADQMPRAAVEEMAAIPADPANNIVAQPHVSAQRAWPGGLPVPTSIPNATTVFPNIAPHQINHAQHLMVQAEVDKAKAVIARNDYLKAKLRASLPLVDMETLAEAEMVPGVQHLVHMSAVTVMRWAIVNLGALNPIDVDAAIIKITEDFTPADLQSKHTLKLALGRRATLKSLIPVSAAPSEYDTITKLHTAFRLHPAAAPLRTKLVFASSSITYDPVPQTKTSVHGNGSTAANTTSQPILYPLLVASLLAFTAIVLQTATKARCVTSSDPT